MSTTAVFVGAVLAIVVVSAAIVIRFAARTPLSPEARGRRAIQNLADDQARRSVWAAASLGAVSFGAGSDDGGGGGCGGGCSGGCGGCGGCGG